jgi:hypothetical protein
MCVCLFKGDQKTNLVWTSSASSLPIWKIFKSYVTSVKNPQYMYACTERMGGGGGWLAKI